MTSSGGALVKIGRPERRKKKLKISENHKLNDDDDDDDDDDNDDDDNDDDDDEDDDDGSNNVNAHYRRHQFRISALVSQTSFRGETGREMSAVFFWLNSELRPQFSRVSVINDVTTLSAKKPQARSQFAYFI